MKNRRLSVLNDARKLHANARKNQGWVHLSASLEKWAKTRIHQCTQTAYKCVQKSAQAVAAAEADRLSAAARIRAKATQYLDKRMDTLLESGQKAYEVKVVMETLRLIADMEKSDAGAAEEAAVQIVEDLTQ